MNIIDMEIEQYMLECYQTTDYNDLTEEERLDVDDMRETLEGRYYDTLRELSNSE